MEHRIRDSDPHLAAMLAIFARLHAGETIASREQSGFRGTRAWCNALVITAAATRAAWLIIGRVRLALRWIAAAVARPCARLKMPWSSSRRACWQRPAAYPSQSPDS